jgi:hypothetical protein
MPDTIYNSRSILYRTSSGREVTKKKRKKKKKKKTKTRSRRKATKWLSMC